MKNFKLLTAILALGLMFGACKKDEETSADGSKSENSLQKAGSCVVTGSMTKSDFDKFGTEYKGSALVTIVEGITIEKVKGNDHALVFGENVAPGALTIAIKNGNGFTSYVFDAECMKGKTYTFSGKDISTLKYGEFEGAVTPKVSFYSLDCEFLFEVPMELDAKGTYWLNWTTYVAAMDAAGVTNADYKLKANEASFFNEFWILEDEGCEFFLFDGWQPRTFKLANQEGYTTSMKVKPATYPLVYNLTVTYPAGFEGHVQVRQEGLGNWNDYGPSPNGTKTIQLTGMQLEKGTIAAGPVSIRVIIGGVGYYETVVNWNGAENLNVNLTEADWN